MKRHRQESCQKREIYKMVLCLQVNFKRSRAGPQLLRSEDPLRNCAVLSKAYHFFTLMQMGELEAVHLWMQLCAYRHPSGTIASAAMLTRPPEQIEGLSASMAGV